jgi:hypothetical protein
MGVRFRYWLFTVARGKIVELDVLADPARLRQFNLTILDSRR